MPNRIIKESICTSDSLASLSWFEQVLFLRLIVSVDDFGRYDARPSILKGRLFALDDVTTKAIQNGLHKLSTQGMINLYEVGGKPFLELTAWLKHNRPRAAESKFPGPDEVCEQLQANENNCLQPQTVENGCEQMSPYSYSDSLSDIRYSSASKAPAGAAPAPTDDVKHKHGEYGWVKLTDEQYNKLVKDLGAEEVERCIAYVDGRAQLTGNKNGWKDWNLVVRNCSRDRWGVSRSNSHNEPVAQEQPIDMDKLNKIAASM